MTDRFLFACIKQLESIFNYDLYDERRNRISGSWYIPGNIYCIFYSGLGLALALAGVIFTKNYLSYNQMEKVMGS